VAVAAQSAFVPLVGGRSPTDDGLSPTLSPSVPRIFPPGPWRTRAAPGARRRPGREKLLASRRRTSQVRRALCARALDLCHFTCVLSSVRGRAPVDLTPHQARRGRSVGRSRCDCEPRETRPARSQCRRELVFQAHNTKWRWTPKFVRPLALGRCMHDCPDQPLARSINHPSVDNTQASGFF
jgi:hypothetical protein